MFPDGDLKLNNSIQGNGIYSAIAQLKEAADSHNATFDEANKIFSDVEDGLSQINVDYWYPFQIFPRLAAQSDTVPSMAPLYYSFQPFKVANYQIGYKSRRLVVRKITSDYDYARDTWGNVVYGPNGLPYTMKLQDDVGDPVPVSDSSREIRVMVIENLPGFIDFVRSSISTHTQTLNWALGNIRSC
jgi:hypothetical protein